MQEGRFVQKRCRRYNVPGHAHELTFSCYRNQKFLLSERICQWLIEALEQARLKHKFSLWAYVFMPDHVHLLIKPEQREYNIADVLKDIKANPARKAIQFLKEENPAGLVYLYTGQKHRQYRFWQDGGGYDRNILKEKTMADTVRYIHNNPVRKGLVEKPSQWYYSSYNCWMKGIEEPIRMDKQTWPLK